MHSLKLLPFLVILLMLASCGTQSAAVIGSQAATASTLTPSAAENGCSTQHIPVDAPVGSKFVVVVGTLGANDAVSVQMRQTIEFKMPANSVWQPNVQDSAGILSEVLPEGWYDSQGSVCVWRYFAGSAGTAKIQFNGMLYCPSKEMCSQIAFESIYTIDVH